MHWHKPATQTTNRLEYTVVLALTHHINYQLRYHLAQNFTHTIGNSSIQYTSIHTTHISNTTIPYIASHKQSQHYHSVHNLKQSQQYHSVHSLTQTITTVPFRTQPHTNNHNSTIQYIASHSHNSTIQYIASHSHNNTIQYIASHSHNSTIHHTASHQQTTTCTAHWQIRHRNKCNI